MLIQILFIISAVICILAGFKMLGAILGNDTHAPLPFLHFVDINATNAYVFSAAVGFQVWYWSQSLFI